MSEPKATWQDAFAEHHQFDVYPDHFMTGLRNEFCAGWHAALKSVDRPSFDAEEHQVLLGYDKNGNPIFGTDPVARAAALKPHFPETFCSACGKSLGPGNEGVSSCGDHK